MCHYQPKDLGGQLRKNETREAGLMSHQSRYVKIVRAEFNQLGLFGRVVASFLALLFFGAAFVFSVFFFAFLVVFALIAVLFPFSASCSSRPANSRIIEGKVVDGENKAEKGS